MKKIFILLMTAFALFTFSIGASAQSSGDLSSSKAKQIALSAHYHHWNVMNGHISNVKNSKCYSGAVKIKGTDYRYFCSELDTKKELTTYLNEVFTLNSINKAIKQYSFIEYKGKLMQPNADGGTILQWEKATNKLIFSKKDVRQFEFTVPYGKTVKYTKKKVTFVKVNNKWQINDLSAVR
ncbi:hypothetical protein CVD28_25655 [Bacillus sp. M6-12]|uniref:IseA DL-endopeptidase inhibitor family protein n=1 Tax=Bacillus sp. M6-12 TaxID=2054166 RepID=UPI000C76601A|nr:IseA DL-endopeptidase inhibitor family protein [Bacillus sp. M6-12]PLS14908.1 hypothetical protein CVD28_25655 [Bacillus sp. M6-12]